MNQGLSKNFQRFKNISRIVAKLKVVHSFLNKTRILTLRYVYSKTKEISKKVKNEFDNSSNSYRTDYGTYG